MSKLCILMVGQMRTFFKECVQYFNDVIDICKTKYDTIHLILIISGECNKLRLEDFKRKMLKKNVTIVVEQFVETQIQSNINAIINNKQWSKMKTKYFSVPNKSHYEINDPDTYIRNGAIHQFFQIKQGIIRMKEYELNKQIEFDVCMKTRFDVKYPQHFYPFVYDSASSFIERICLTECNKHYFSKWFKTTDELKTHINFLKNEKIKLPECRTTHYNYSFGGAYMNNYISLEEIVYNNATNILYMYNDHVIFGKRSEFVKLEDFADNYGTIEIDTDVNHYFSQEAQLLIYSFSRKIVPIMYLHGDCTIIRF